MMSQKWLFTDIAHMGGAQPAGQRTILIIYKP